jgi:hypothetical protein
MHRGVTDRVSGDLEAVADGDLEQVVELLVGLVRLARAGAVGVRLAALGGPGVE